MYCHISSHICQQGNYQCCAERNKGQQAQEKGMDSAQRKTSCTVASAGGRGAGREAVAGSNSMNSEGGQRPESQ